jgi:hypothetical protein
MMSAARLVRNAKMAVRTRRPAPTAGDLGDSLDLLAALLAAGVIVFVWLGATGVPRLLLSLGFAVFVPGRAIVTNWPRVAGWSEAAITVAFSLAFLILVTTVALWTHYWHPLGLAQALAALSLAGLAVGVLRRRTDHRRAPANPPGSRS